MRVIFKWWAILGIGISAAFTAALLSVGEWIRSLRLNEYAFGRRRLNRESPFDGHEINDPDDHTSNSSGQLKSLRFGFFTAKPEGRERVAPHLQSLRQCSAHAPEMQSGSGVYLQ